MQQQHKQRLIGAVVVVALAVIFLPMLLQGPVDRSTTDVSMDIPDRPEVELGPGGDPGETPPTGELEAVPLPEETGEPPADEADDPGDAPPPAPESEDALASARDDAEAAEPDTEPEAEDAEADTDADAEVEPVDEAPQDDDELASWAVQVGSFGSEDNALGLRDRLREQDFSAYVERVEREGDDPVYRLRVGPVVERDEAQELLERLADEADLDGLVVSHP